jgi:uncharacterized Zn finger protein (UPF0148 family)
MPCPNCTGLLIYFDDGDIRCPKCDRLAVLDYKSAIKVATRIALVVVVPVAEVIVTIAEEVVHPI